MLFFKESSNANIFSCVQSLSLAKIQTCLQLNKSIDVSINMSKSFVSITRSLSQYKRSNSNIAFTMKQKLNSDQISSGVELSPGELDMIRMRDAKENEKIFKFLDDVLPDKSLIPRSSNHVKELYEAFRTERFQKCCDLKYLNKVIQWLNALQGEILVFFRGKEILSY